MITLKLTINLIKKRLKLYLLLGLKGDNTISSINSVVYLNTAQTVGAQVP